MNIAIIRERKGITLVELVVVISIIGILAAIGVPEYGRFVAKSEVKRAANDLMQNMRLARTLAIKENRTYLITFNTVANTYRIGFDGNNDGDLLDATADGFNGAVGEVRVINIQNEYGNDIVLGSGTFAITPLNGPNNVDITVNATNFNFLSDGSTSTNGIVYLQHIGRGYVYCVEFVNAAGLINLFMWDGEAGNPDDTGWTEIR